MKLYGWLVSPYSAKVRAMLAHKRIPFIDATPSLEELEGAVSEKVGRVIMPTVMLHRPPTAQACGKDKRAESDVGAIASLLEQQNRAGEEDAGRLVKRVEALEERLAKRAPPPCAACTAPHRLSAL